MPSVNKSNHTTNQPITSEESLKKYFRINVDDITHNNIGQLKVIFKSTLPIQYADKFYSDVITSRFSRLGKVKLDQSICISLLLYVFFFPLN